jgi:hypothetical protein
MANFVLVHRAWHGGWCYRYTANELRGRGHVVVTPTLTGVGERFHASSKAITLETHIRDVVGCIEAEELDQVVLCGSAAISRRHSRRGAGTAFGMVMPLSAEMFNVAPARRDWVTRRCVPQPLATFEMPILLLGQAEAIERRLFVLADNWDSSPFRFFATKYEGVAGWQIVKMRCGHSVMVDMPSELAAVPLTIWPENGFRDLAQRGHLDQDFEELRRGGMWVSEEVLFGAAQKKHQNIVFRCDSSTRRADARA